jgi:hypothetical protein
VMQELAKDGVPCLWLWIIDGNREARNLYEKLGFSDADGSVPLADFPGRSETRMTFDLSCPLRCDSAESLSGEVRRLVAD